MQQKSLLPKSFTPELLAQLELLKLRTRRAFLGNRQGQHVSLRKGHGIEFSDHRDYQPGDSPRSIDWAVYARTEKLYIKRFQEDENLSLLILLDCSASMGVATDKIKWQRAQELAIALAYIGLMEQDSIIFNPISTTSHASYKFSGAKAIYQIAELVQSIEPSGRPETHQQILESLSKLKSPGLAVFISDLLFDYSSLDQIFLPLRAANLEISSIQILGEKDYQPFELGQDYLVEDSETAERIQLSFSESDLLKYQRELKQHISDLSDYFNSSGINFLTLNSASSIVDIFAKELPKLGLLQ